MISLPTLYGLTGVLLAGIGLLALVLRAHAIRKLVGLNIMGSGIFLLMIALARRAPGGAPDPVPHAMVLTGIVVAVSVTAVALLLLHQIASSGGDAASTETDRPAP